MSDLKTITELAKVMERHEVRVAALTEELAKAKGELRQIAEVDLPEAMVEAGVTELKLDDGRPLTLEEDCKAAITDRTRERALAWMMSNGYGGMIKTEVVARFDRGAHDEATRLSQAIAETHDEVELKETVHPSTLKAFVKEQMREGRAIPMDLFNVHPYQKATLKKGK